MAMTRRTAAFLAVGGAAAAAIMYRRFVTVNRRNLTKLRFDLTPEQLNSLADEIIRRSDTMLNGVAAVPEAAASWETVIAPQVALDEDLDALSSSITFLKHVAPVEAVRNASNEATMKLTDYINKARMRFDVYSAVKNYADKKPELAGERKRYLTNTMRDFRRMGMHLDKETRDKIEALNTECSQLCQKFQRNLAECKTKLYFDKSELEGMDDRFLSGLRQVDGKYELTLAYPHVLPILDRCSVESTRRQMEIAFNSRCKEENVPILERVRVIRAEVAQLQGYASHSHFAVEICMAKNPETIISFLTKLAHDMEPVAARELAGLKALKAVDLKVPVSEVQFNHWDTRYYTERELKEKYQIDATKVSEYFPLGTVMKGMFGIYQELLGLKFTEVDHPHVWHSDVRMVAVHSSNNNELLGYFYLDLHPREGKYGHAACFPLQKSYGFKADGTRQNLAVAALVCNFTAPTSTSPSLLNHDEVVTLFHEFGHVMHHICSHTEMISFASFETETDFVETPSQMLENWCWEPETLQRMSGHFQRPTEVLPTQLANALVRTKNAHVGIFTRRQLLFGLLDQTLHSVKPTDTMEPLRDMIVRLQTEIMGIPPSPGTNFLGTFGHLVGGYDAKYYGYMWSEVYSFDLFDRFRREGLVNPTVGAEYRNKILRPGGSVDAIDMVTNFLGRPPTTDAFLRSKGLTTQ